MEERFVQIERAIKYVEDITAGAIGYEIESRSLPGLQVVRAQTGFLHCKFVVPKSAADENGNWHAGAIATVIDNVVGATVLSVSDRMGVTVSFDISYYSTAKIQDEVEIKAKVLGNKGKLTSAMVEVRNKQNGKLIAAAKQWTTANANRSPMPMPKL